MISDVAVAAVRRYCDRKVPPDRRDKVRLDVEVRGTAVTVFERRPPWGRDVGDMWTKVKVAQFRFDVLSKTWSLYWADRNGRWHRYEDVDRSANIADLLDEVEADPTGIFFG